MTAWHLQSVVSATKAVFIISVSVQLSDAAVKALAGEVTAGSQWHLEGCYCRHEWQSQAPAEAVLSSAEPPQSKWSLVQWGCSLLPSC